MRKLMVVILSSIIILGGLYIWLNVSEDFPGNPRIIETQETAFGKAVLFEDKLNLTFGVGRLEHYMGFMYRHNGSAYGNEIKEGLPFEAVGYGAGSEVKKDGLLIGIKVAEGSGIKYIAVGNHMEDVGYQDRYELSLADVKANMELYQLKEVVNSYALFVVDTYTEDTWTIRCFDENGVLVADKLYLGSPRYLKW